jgi:chorismate mutase/prephenate dehydratase
MSKGSNGQQSIQALRKRIDKVDDELLRLLFFCATLETRVGHLKRGNGMAAYWPAREFEILERVARMNGGPLRGAAVKRIFRQIVWESRSVAIREVAK